MELINNTTKTLKDDLTVEIKEGSKISIAAACFSIYAFQELKKQLVDIAELRFIFTSPTFIAEKTKKEKREFYIPRLNRERSLYGTEFEIKLRNELTQKAIARECADWIRDKVVFKSNISDKTIQGQMVVDEVGYTPINNFTTVELGCEKSEMNEYEVSRGDSFVRESSGTYTLKHAETSQIKYDLIGKVAEGTALTRRTVSAILQGIRWDKLYMFRNNPEEFISKVIRLINEQKATVIVEHISYDTIEGEYDSSIFTAEKNMQSFDKAFLAKKAIQDYVFTDGAAEKSIERKFAEDLDAAKEVCVYAKLPRTFHIPTPVGNYSPDWAIAFHEGTVKHIFFIAETKGTMESLELRPVEQAKISCAKKLFNEMSTSSVKYHDVDSYQSLLNIMNSL